MRSILVGTVTSTRVTLDELVRQSMPPAAVLTVHPSRAGQNATYIDLVPLCERYNIPVRTFRSINEPEILEYVGKLQPDIAFVIGLSQLVSPAFLSIPRIGCLGFHPAPLPENRGRAVIAWTIIQACQETGSTLFWIDEGVDAGPIALQRRFEVSPEETAQSLLDKHMQVLRDMLKELLPRLRRNEIPAIPQDERRATWCAKREPRDGVIDWQRPAQEIWTLIRAVGSPYHGALSEFRGRQVAIWEAELVKSDEKRYWGVSGQIQSLVDGRPSVMCGSRERLLLGKVTYCDSGECIYQEDPPRVHERFGG